MRLISQGTWGSLTALLECLQLPSLPLEKISTACTFHTYGTSGACWKRPHSHPLHNDNVTTTHREVLLCLTIPYNEFYSSSQEGSIARGAVESAQPASNASSGLVVARTLPQKEKKPKRRKRWIVSNPSVVPEARRSGAAVQFLRGRFPEDSSPSFLVSRYPHVLWIRIRADIDLPRFRFSFANRKDCTGTRQKPSDTANARPLLHMTNDHRRRVFPAPPGSAPDRTISKREGRGPSMAIVRGDRGKSCDSFTHHAHNTRCAFVRSTQEGSKWMNLYPPHTFRRVVFVFFGTDEFASWPIGSASVPGALLSDISLSTEDLRVLSLQNKCQLCLLENESQSMKVCGASTAQKVLSTK